MITDEMKRFAAYLLEGDLEAAKRLYRVMERLGYGHKEKDKSFSFEDDLFDFEPRRFRGEAGQKYRVSLAWWPGSEEQDPDFKATSPRFLQALRHWNTTANCFVLNKGPEYTELLGKPKMSAVTAIVSWPVQENGKVIPEQVSKRYIIHPWIISMHYLKDVREIHEKFPLNEYDLILGCEDHRFQRFSLQPTKGNLLQRLQKTTGEKKLLFETISRKTSILISSIEEHLGRNLPLDQVREMIREDPPVEALLARWR